MLLPCLWPSSGFPLPWESNAQSWPCSLGSVWPDPACRLHLPLDPLLLTLCLLEEHTFLLLTLAQICAPSDLSTCCSLGPQTCHRLILSSHPLDSSDVTCNRLSGTTPGKQCPAPTPPRKLNRLPYFLFPSLHSTA